jgi:hypothetical protein
MPAALRHFRVAILIQIGVERNERVIERIALDPDPRRTRLGCRDNYFIDATGVPFQRQLPGLAGFDPLRPDATGSYQAGQLHCRERQLTSSVPPACRVDTHRSEPLVVSNA